MASQLSEKIAIGYLSCGQTFREITLYQLEHNCIDDDNIYYLILTDDKEYFNQCTRKNLVVNEISEYYKDYPEIEKNEDIVITNNASEYYDKLLNRENKFSFSLYRFHLLQAQKLGITNVGMMCVDSCFNFKAMISHDAVSSTFEHLFSVKSSLYNAVAVYETTKNHNKQLALIWDVLKQKYNYETDQEITPTPDAAARFFVFESEEQMMRLFTIWNEVIAYLYETGIIKLFEGSRVVNDEFILSPIYNMAGIKHFSSGPFSVDHRLMDVFWEGFGNVKFDIDYVKANNLIISNQ